MSVRRRVEHYPLEDHLGRRYDDIEVVYIDGERAGCLHLGLHGWWADEALVARVPQPPGRAPRRYFRSPRSATGSMTRRIRAAEAGAREEAEAERRLAEARRRLREAS